MDITLCTVGCGLIANMVHGPAYARLVKTYPQVRLAACCDKDENKAASFAGQFGFARHYTDLQEMLDAEKPDAVCLSAPARLTARLSSAILEQGYPLLLEKPPGINREETEAIIQAAAKGSVPNQVAFNRRYMPVVTELKRLLEERHRPEEIHSIRYDLYRGNRLDEDFAETAIHGIDTVRFIAGADYEHVAFEYQEFPHLGPGVANIFMYARMTSGAIARLSFCPVAGITVERTSVSLLNSTYYADLPIWNSVDTPGGIKQFVMGKLELDIPGDQLCDVEDMSVSNGFYQENESFLLDLLAGRKPTGDVASALQSVEIADCIRRRRREYRRQV